MIAFEFLSVKAVEEQNCELLLSLFFHPVAEEQSSDLLFDICYSGRSSIRLQASAE